MPETASFRPLDICRYQTFLIGSAKIARSMMMFGMALPKKNFRVLMHLEGVVISQKPWIGVQENIETRRHAAPQASTKALTTLVAMMNPRVGKIER